MQEVATVPHTLAQLSADRTEVAVVAVGRDSVRCDAGHRFGGAEERLGGRHVAVLAEQHINQVPVPVDSAIQAAPAPMYLQVHFIHVPAQPTLRRRRSMKDKRNQAFRSPHRVRIWECGLISLTTKPSLKIFPQAIAFVPRG